VHLAFMGTGPDAGELHRRIEHSPLRNVHWIEEYVLDRDRIRRFLGAADVYAFPSRHEGFPVAPVEAMASGLPVVAADAPGISDLFSAGPEHGGLVVPRGEPVAFAHALQQLLTDRDRRRTLGANARARVEAAFSLPSVGAELAGALFPERPARPG
jgi:glycosyltransferase involved in cell wall biosynthesis